jgi:hypothetical protein
LRGKSLGFDFILVGFALMSVVSAFLESDKAFAKALELSKSSVLGIRDMKQPRSF